MKTARVDVERNKRQVLCPNSSFRCMMYFGYSSNRLRYGDMFIYHETYTDGTFHPILAKCHGQVKPLNRLEGDKPDVIRWYVLAQAVNVGMTHTFERWVNPMDVVETIPRDHVNAHIARFFEERLASDGLI